MTAEKEIEWEYEWEFVESGRWSGVKRTNFHMTDREAEVCWAQREVDFDMWALAVPRINDSQHANASATRQRIRHEVHCPAFVGAVGRRHDHAQMTRTLLSPFQAKRQAFGAVQPLSPFVVLDQPLPA